MQITCFENIEKWTQNDDDVINNGDVIVIPESECPDFHNRYPSPSPQFYTGKARWNVIRYHIEM